MLASGSAASSAPGSSADVGSIVGSRGSIRRRPRPTIVPAEVSAGPVVSLARDPAAEVSLTSIVDAPEYLFTSESVTEGHPDKLCDQVSDAILDSIIREDPQARVACETATTTGLVIVLGEITTKTYVDFQQVVRETVRDIGYTRADYGFDYETCGTLISIKEQSPDIAQGVERGARDPRRDGRRRRDRRGRPGNDVRLRLPRDARADAAADRAGASHGPPPRRGAQVGPAAVPAAGRQDPGDRRVRARRARSGCAPSSSPAQHDPDVRIDRLQDDLIEAVDPAGDPARAARRRDPVMHVNPTGRFVIGGPMGDAGLTGRKIIVDSYGGMARHGGGCFSGKDPTKVDRSGAYAARWVAKNVVAAGLADRFEIEIAYAIGDRPAAVAVDRDVRHRPSRRRAILGLIERHFDLRPAAIIDAPRPAPPDLPPDRGVRPLRPARPRPALGAHRQGRGSRRRGWRAGARGLTGLT